MSDLTVTLNGDPAVLDEHGIVDAEGYEISWQEFLDGEVDCLPDESPVPLVVVCTENGYGAREVSTYLIGESLVVRHYREDDSTDVSIEAGVNDPTAFALDAAADDLRAVAVSVLGPLLDGDPDLSAPEFQHTPWTDEMGGNAAEDPMLYWTRGAHLDPRVEHLFRERIAAGAYPEIAEMQKIGSGPWRQWVRSLLTAVPPDAVEYGVVKDGYPLYEEDAVDAMLDDELVEAAREAFRRPAS